MIRHDAQTLFYQGFTSLSQDSPPQNSDRKGEFPEINGFPLCYKGFRSSLGIFTIRLLGGEILGGDPSPPDQGAAYTSMSKPYKTLVKRRIVTNTMIKGSEKSGQMWNLERIL